MPKKIGRATARAESEPRPVASMTGRSAAKLVNANLEDLLDDALFRRFDDVIRYRTPNESDLRGLIANRLAAFQLDEETRGELALLAVGLSHADVCRACDEAAKMAVLGDRREISCSTWRCTYPVQQEVCPCSHRSKSRPADLPLRLSLAYPSRPASHR